MPLLDQPIAALARHVRAGLTTFAELAEEALANRRQDLGAYRHVNDALVRAQAAAADVALAAGYDLGPLMGMPVSVKDLYGVPGFPIHAGTPRALPESFAAPGPVVESLRRAMAVVTGKTHTVELAYGGLGTNPHTDTPTNPWDDRAHRVPGGSSAGAGVSLCEGSAVLALGTDTAGSVRIPAAWTGKVGLKTTAGRWSTEGVVPLSSTLDTAGVLASTVDDVLLAFACVDPRWPSVQSLREALGRRDAPSLRLGRCDRFFWDDLSPGVGEAVEDALEELDEAGARQLRLDVPEVEPTYELFRLGGPVSVELHRFLETRLPGWAETLDPNVRARVGDAATLPAAEYLDRLARMAALGAAVEARLRDVDVLVAPTVALTPPTVDEVATADGYRPRNLLALRNTCIASYLGLCAITLPVDLDAAGMPVGLMLMARGGHEEALLSVAATVEATLGTGAERLGTPPRLAD